MSSIEYLTITHPELGVSRIVASSLPVWLDRGWVVDGQEVDTPSEAPSATPEENADAVTPSIDE